MVLFWGGPCMLVDCRIAQAIVRLRTVVEVDQQFAGTDSGTSGLVYGSLLEALYQSDRIDEARELLDQQLELVEAVGLPDSLMYAWRVRARIERLDEDHASALKTLQRSEEHTSELQSLMRSSYAVFCLKKKKKKHI